MPQLTFNTDDEQQLIEQLQSIHAGLFLIIFEDGKHDDNTNNLMGVVGGCSSCLSDALVKYMLKDKRLAQVVESAFTEYAIRKAFTAKN